MEDTINCLGGITLILFLLFIGAYEEIKSRSLIKAWAQKNKFKIISIDRHYRKLRNIVKPHFPHDGYSPIYYVTIEDNGVSKNAYIKFGNAWFGILGNGFEVKWAENEHIDTS